MAATALKQNSIFPDLPRDSTFVDKEGKLTPAWQLYFSQLNQALQSNFTPEGFVLPAQTASNISLLGSSEPGTILYNSTTKKGMINEDFIFKTITTS
jgi:hypothetical protein